MESSRRFTRSSNAISSAVIVLCVLCVLCVLFVEVDVDGNDVDDVDDDDGNDVDVVDVDVDVVDVVVDDDDEVCLVFLPIEMAGRVVAVAGVVDRGVGVEGESVVDNRNGERGGERD